LRGCLLSAWARRGSAIAGGRHRLSLSLLTIIAVGGVANTGAPVGQGFHRLRSDLRGRRSGAALHIEARSNAPLEATGVLVHANFSTLSGETARPF